MDSARSAVVWLLLVGLSLAAAVRPSNSTDCADICSKCDEKQERRHCLVLCPTLDYPYNLCKHASKYSEAVIGISIGVVLFVIIGMIGLICIRIRRSKKVRVPKQSAKDLKKFHRELERLKPHSYTFLAILNDIRRHIREMDRAGNGEAAIMWGRSLADLAKILMLLNRRDVPIVPPDWPRLYSWAERLLERAPHSPAPLHQQQRHQHQRPVASAVDQQQLIHFFQHHQSLHHRQQQQETPSPSSKASSSQRLRRGDKSSPSLSCSSTSAVAPPPPYEDSVPMRAFRTGEWATTAHERWEFPQELPPQLYGQHERQEKQEKQLQLQQQQQDEAAWTPANPTALRQQWIDDDFFLTIGFRPQDEIVTVL